MEPIRVLPDRRLVTGVEVRRAEVLRIEGIYLLEAEKWRVHAILYGDAYSMGETFDVVPASVPHIWEEVAHV